MAMSKPPFASRCFALCLWVSCVAALNVPRVAEQGGEEKNTRTRRSDDGGPLEAVVSRLSQDLTQLQAGLQALQSRATGQEAELQALNNRDAGQDAKLQALETPVGFTVRFSRAHVTGLGLNQPVVFDTVDYNAGGGYDKNTGTFTAPASGTYVFVLSIQCHGSDETTIIMNIKKGSVLLGRAEAGYSPYEHGAMTVTYHLNQGDAITVQTAVGTMVYGSTTTVFTGFRISPQ